MYVRMNRPAAPAVTSRTDGIRSRAYLLRGNDPGEEMWYPAGDLARIADVH